MSEDKKLEALTRDNKMRAAIERQASKYSGLAPVPPFDIPDDISEATTRPWKPVTAHMAFFKREERGIYQDTNGDGLFYFKATHWRYLK
jgi:hypothetical protein